jgi:hypothetical protein
VPLVWCNTIAFGLMRLPADTFGVLSSFSGYLLGLFAFVLGALFGGFALGFGAAVDFAVEESEEFGKVGRGPRPNGANKRFR